MILLVAVVLVKKSFNVQNDLLVVSVKTCRKLVIFCISIQILDF